MPKSIAMERTSSEAELPERATSGSFGYDLACLKDTLVDPRETRVIPTGLRLARDLPMIDDEGVAMLVLPRSSLPLEHNLIVANSPGLIDADYSGDIGVIVHNFGHDAVLLEQGTRIAQALFVKVVIPEIAEAAADPERDRGGFGSTGT